MSCSAEYLTFWTKIKNDQKYNFFTENWLKLTKIGFVYPPNWPKFRTGQYEYDDHPYFAPKVYTRYCKSVKHPKKYFLNLDGYPNSYWIDGAPNQSKGALERHRNINFYTDLKLWSKQAANYKLTIKNWNKIKRLIIDRWPIYAKMTQFLKRYTGINSVATFVK